MGLIRNAILALAAVLAATGAHAQIAFRAAAQASMAAGTAGPITHVGAGAAATNFGGCPRSVTPAIPAGANGDLLIALVNSREDASVITASATWTQLYGAAYGGGGQDFEVYLYYKFADGADAFTFTQSGTCNSLAAQVSRFSNVNPVTPFINVPIPGGNVVQQNSNNIDTGTETTTDPDAMLLVASFVNDNNNVCEAAGWNASFETQTTSGRDLSLSLHYQLQTTAGPKQITNWSHDATNDTCPSPDTDENFGIIFALRSASSLTINVPAGTVANDVMVASIAVRDSPITITAPAGWTLVREDVQGGGGGATSRMATYSRVASGAEPASYTWVFGGGAHTGAAGIISSFSGVDVATPIDVHNGATTASSDVHTAPSVTTTTAGTMLVGSFEYGSSTSNWTTSMTEALESSSLAPPNDLGISMVMAYEPLAAAGASGTRSATADLTGANADQGVAQLLALRPTSMLQVTLAGGVDNINAGSIFLTGARSGAPEAVNTGTIYGSATITTGITTLTNNAWVVDVAGSGNSGSFTSPGAQAERWDTSAASSTAVSSTKPVAVAGATSMQQTHSTTSNRTAHAVASFAPSGAIAFVSAASANVNASSTLSWTHAVPASGKLIVGIGIEAPGDPCPAASTVSSVTHNGVPLTRVATVDANSAGFCQRIEIWYLDFGVIADHFAISHTGSGVACVDQAITITAHDAAHSPVDAGARTVNLSTTNGKGTWTGIISGGGLLSDPTAGDGAATYTFAGGSSQVQLAFRYADLAATSETFGFNVSGGGISETSGTASATDDPSFLMSQAGFRFRNITDGNTTIPTQLSGKPSNTGFNAKTLRLQAIRTDTVTGACTGLFASQTRTVELGAECNNPAACAGRQVRVNATNVATSNDNGGPGAAAYTGVALAFNASSEADTVITYPDAGQISLHARYDLDPLVGGFEANGASNAFIVRPLGLAFPGVSHASTAAGALIGAAGDNFAMTVQAFQWAAGEDADDDGVPDAGVNLTDNGDVPNFAATATLGVAANLPGVANGALSRGAGCANPASIAMAGGAGAAADWCYSEAGNALLTADVTSYLGAGVDITGNSGLDGDPGGGHVGRFSPKHFVVTGAPTLTNRAALACPSSFTYLSEGLRLGFTLEARNTQNVLTQNYTGAYAKLDLTSMANLGIGARSGATILTSRVDNALAPTGSFTNGVAAITATTAIRRASPDNPDGPFAGTQFGIAPADADGVQMQSFDLDADSVPGNDHFAIAPTSELRYGRLELDNNYGPVLQPVPLPISTQYWNGSAFARNTLDSCTTLARANIALAFGGALNPCETAVQQASIAFAGGAATLTLAAPGTGNAGAVLLTPQLGTAAGSYCPAVGAGALAATASPAVYLLGRWNDGLDPDGNPATAYDDKPSGQAGFGLYGSQPRNFIFFRENY